MAGIWAGDECEGGEVSIRDKVFERKRMGTVEEGSAGAGAGTVEDGCEAAEFGTQDEGYQREKETKRIMRRVAGNS